MKKSNVIMLIIIAVIVLFGIGACGAYNGMVEKQETATTALADVQATYQRISPRRCRLMPSTSARPLKRSPRQELPWDR